MPSNQTPNYALSQWERADRVLMDDFNNDNAKIDEALAGKLGPIEIISTGAPAQSTKKFEIDLTHINWPEWSVVIVAIDLDASPSSDNRKVYLSPVPRSMKTTDNTTLAACNSGFIGTIFFPWHCKFPYTYAVGFPGATPARWSRDISELTGMECIHAGAEDGYIRANGTKYAILGIR